MRRGQTAVVFMACCSGIMASSSRAGAQTAEPPGAHPPVGRATSEAAPAPDPPSASIPTTTRSWYGYQILAADAAATALVFWGGGNNGAGATTASTLGVTLYLTDGVAVHALHHHPYKALASAGLRVGAPILCGFL